jgi:hypothetical protein
MMDMTKRGRDRDTCSQCSHPTALSPPRTPPTPRVPHRTLCANRLQPTPLACRTAAGARQPVPPRR